VELGGRHGGTAAAICNTGGNLFGMIAPPLTPFVSHALMAQFGLSEQVGWQWGIALGGVVCLAGAILWLWIEPPQTDHFSSSRIALSNTSSTSGATRDTGPVS
jgi:hypothetical protein